MDRGSIDHPEVGTKEYSLLKAHDTIKHGLHIYKKVMMMVEPSMAALTASQKRAAHSLARLRALPRDPTRGEMAK